MTDQDITTAMDEMDATDRAALLLVHASLSGDQKKYDSLVDKAVTLLETQPEPDEAGAEALIVLSEMVAFATVLLSRQYGKLDRPDPKMVALLITQAVIKNRKTR